MKSWIKVLVWMLLITLSVAIFWFSSQPADKSSKVSSGVLTKVLEKSIPGYNNMPHHKKAEMINTYHKLIRKCAHYSLYTLWGLLMCSLLGLYNIKGYRRPGITLASGFLYAVSDEIHQFFVDGRSAQITDVLLDASGVMTGALIVVLVGFAAKKILDSKEKNN